jgi:hypothetical protein
MKYFYLAIVFQVSCIKEAEPIDFPDGIEPIEDIRVDAPQGSDSNPYPETFNLTSGDEEEYGWAHLSGYIHIDMAQAWEAIRDDSVYINQRSMVNEGSGYIVEEVPSPEYDYVYSIDNTVKDANFPAITVEFQTEWRHLAVKGSKEAPEHVGIRWQKVSGAEGIIDLIEGSVQILPVADGRKGVVEVQVIEHLTALIDQENNAIEFVEDLYERWVLVAHGSDIPTYE